MLVVLGILDPLACILTYKQRVCVHVYVCKTYIYITMCVCTLICMCLETNAGTYVGMCL